VLENKFMKYIHDKVLVIPGSFSLVSVYEGYKGIDIWLKKNESVEIGENDWIIAHSAGVNYLLSQNISNNQKIILINPLVKKRKFISLVIRDIEFFIAEGMKKAKIIPLSSWFYASKKVLRLLRINVLENLQKLPKENIVIIRGVKDYYFCDSENAELIKKEGFALFEVDAAHNWNQNIANKVEEIIKNVK